MKRPGTLVRVAGAPMPAFLLFVVYIAVVSAWYEANAPWWLALIAFIAGVRTFAAISAVRRYKAWRREWDSLGQLDETPLPVKRRGARRFVIVSAALLLTALSSYVPELRADEPWMTVLHFVQGTAAFYLFFAIARALMRKTRSMAGRRKHRTKEEPEGASVSWRVTVPSSSPTRRSAERSLPKYCARLAATRRQLK